MRLEFIEAGEIVSTHGIRGEVKVLPWVDSPELLLDFERVKIGNADYKVDSCRVQKTCNLMKLQGVDTVEDAMILRGKTVLLYREDIDPDVIFAAELIGMTVLENGKELGKITDVLDYPGNKVYVVKGEHEYMIPAVKAFILSTDMENEVMEVKTIEGMRTDES